MSNLVPEFPHLPAARATGPAQLLRSVRKSSPSPVEETGEDIRFDILPYFPYHAQINRAIALFLLTCDHFCGLSAGKLEEEGGFPLILSENRK